MHNHTRREALRIGEDKYRTIFENALMGIYQTTARGRYITVNEAFARIFGYDSPAEMIHSTMDNAGRLYDDPEYRKRCLERARREGHCTVQAQIIRRDGTSGWVLNQVRAIRDERGHVEYYEGFVQDISEEKWALQALKESEECFATAFRANPVPDLISTLEEGRFIDVNDRWLRMLGYTREEMIGRTVSELGIWADVRIREALMVKLRKEGFLREEPVPFRTKSGEIRDILWSVEIMKYKGRKVIVSIPYDVTEHRRAADEREKLIGELEKALADIKKLSGLLPICASCKKIRNDEGYWEQIEVYIRERSEADFSHGICPACVKKLYPEFYKK